MDVFIGLDPPAVNADGQANHLPFRDELVMNFLILNERCSMLGSCATLEHEIAEVIARNPMACSRLTQRSMVAR